MNNKKILKKVLSFIFSFVLIFTAVPFFAAGAVTSGTTGDCTWTLDGTVLTISGNGAMADYGYHSDDSAPWGRNITKVIIKSGITSIGDYAFFGCAGLTSVTIPNGITSIGSYTFELCTGLKNVIIPNSVTSISPHIFGGCTKLNSVTLPNSITSIGWGAFDGCSGLTSIIIPNSVTSIDGWAFAGCTGLANITIPNNVNYLGKYAFLECSNLRKINIPNGIKHMEGCFLKCVNLSAIEITDIEAWCNIVFDSIYDDISGYTITSNPLYYAHSLYLNGKLVKDLVIPDNVKSINSGAFYGCTGLKNITIPDSVISIGDAAFGNTSPNLVIATSENSAAYKYAKLNNIKLYLTKITRYISPPDLEKMQSNGNISVKITLKPTDNYEYKCNNGSWQKSNIFNNLLFDTDYTFYQRLSETSENVASSPSEPKTIHTKKKNISVPVAPEIISKTAFSITLKEIDGYEYSIDGINWQKSNVFGGLESIHEYTFYQRFAQTDVFCESEKSVGITIKTDKKTPGAPDIPTSISKTDTSITLKSINGYEYSIDNINWQGDPVFKNLKPETEYYLYQRIAETDETYSSVSSDFLIIKTYPERYCTDCLNTGIGADGKSCATCFGSGRFHMVGDADSDDEITDWDSVLCMRYLSGWNVEIPSKKCFDIDGDKRITDWDGVLFDRYLAGWNQETNIGAIVKGYPEHKHTYGNWIIESDPTCTVEGEKYRLCTICENDETVEIEKIPHNYEDWVTDKNATCTLKGEKHRICSACGYEEISEIPKTAHSYGGWIIDKDSTCLVTGEKHHICLTCGYSENSIILKKSHIVTYWIIDIPSTCAYEGSKHGECDNCGKTVSQTINKLAHNWSNFIIMDHGTCIKNGYKERYCYTCGKVEQIGMGLGSHKYVNGYCIYCNKKGN